MVYHSWIAAGISSISLPLPSRRHEPQIIFITSPKEQINKNEENRTLNPIGTEDIVKNSWFSHGLTSISLPLPSIAASTTKKDIDNKKKHGLTPYGIGDIHKSSWFSHGLSSIKLPFPTTASKITKKETPTPSKRIIKVGDEVKYSHGRGKIIEIRDDGMHVVEAKSWHLANGEKPKTYMLENGLTWAPPKAAYEMNKLEKIEAATETKGNAMKCFIDGDITNACNLYSRCISFLQFIDHVETTDMERAQMLELMISCNNNIATCRLKLGEYGNAVEAAKTAHQLCAALEDNKTGRVIRCLQKRGISEEKIFFNWYRKALFLQGKGNFLKKEYQESVNCLQKALQRTVNQPGASKDESEIQKLLEQATRNLALENRKAKKMWRAAFEKNSETVNDDATVDSNNRSAPSFEPRKVTKKNSKISGTTSEKNNIDQDAAPSVETLQNILKRNLSRVENEDSDDECIEIIERDVVEANSKWSNGVKYSFAALAIAGIAYGVSKYTRHRR